MKPYESHMKPYESHMGKRCHMSRWVSPRARKQVDCSLVMPCHPTKGRDGGDPLVGGSTISPITRPKLPKSLRLLSPCGCVSTTLQESPHMIELCHGWCLHPSQVHGLEYTFKPQLGDVPEFCFPDALPGLTAVADLPWDLDFSSWHVVVWSTVCARVRAHVQHSHQWDTLYLHVFNSSSIFLHSPSQFGNDRCFSRLQPLDRLHPKPLTVKTMQQNEVAKVAKVVFCG